MSSLIQASQRNEMGAGMNVQNLGLWQCVYLWREGLALQRHWGNRWYNFSWPSMNARLTNDRVVAKFCHHHKTVPNCNALLVPTGAYNCPRKQNRSHLEWRAKLDTLMWDQWLDPLWDFFRRITESRIFHECYLRWASPLHGVASKVCKWSCSLDTGAMMEKVVPPVVKGLVCPSKQVAAWERQNHCGQVGQTHLNAFGFSQNFCRCFVFVFFCLRRGVRLN